MGSSVSEAALWKFTLVPVSLVQSDAPSAVLPGPVAEVWAQSAVHVVGLATADCLVHHKGSLEHNKLFNC